MSTINEALPPPSKCLLFAEGRFVLEWGAYYAMQPLMDFFPKGDGHPVMLLPGFGASDISTGLIRKQLRQLGYRVHGWKAGRNLGGYKTLDTIAVRLDEIFDRYRKKVSLVGQSLGGVYARELARRWPQKVRQVITLGSPINVSAYASNATNIYRKVSPEGHIRETREQFYQRIQPIPVRSTAVYSKTDGIVAWPSAMESPHPLSENIEVRSSHIGMAVSPEVVYVIANRLSQPLDDWTPFYQSLRHKVFYPRPAV